MKVAGFGCSAMLLLMPLVGFGADAPARPAEPPDSAFTASPGAQGRSPPAPAALAPPFPDVNSKAPEVVIEGKRNPFAESDENLRRLSEGLPDLDSSLKKPEGPGLASALLQAFLPAEPPPKPTDSADRADEQGLHGVCAAGNQWGCVYRDQDP